ncbi:hypothetical protein [Bradyrhizobium sp. 45]|uniref:hypothetical protein n=1 Tax=Bradyrhizobium sp. 45 TaxID=1043587 RepID=UPI001FF80729|nr:hypothetical protein [Bradyrhizobium sp. 45]MCK1306245.1 hypothetical protein [Bradyrhizobium sp. 45]
MIRIYVEQADLTFEVEDGFVLGIAKGRRPTPDIECEFIDATLERLHVTRAPKTLHLDWLALTDLAAWLYRKYPNATEKGYMNRLLDLFPGSMNVNDVMRALMRCISDNEHLAHGEDAHFCGHIRRTHKLEFEEIRAAWFAQIRQSGRPFNNVQ